MHIQLYCISKCEKESETGIAQDEQLHQHRVNEGLCEALWLIKVEDYYNKVFDIEPV